MAIEPAPDPQDDNNDNDDDDDDDDNTVCNDTQRSQEEICVNVLFKNTLQGKYFFYSALFIISRCHLFHQ